ncbi:TraK family protein [Pseudomonas panipatensis]|uniref:TraK family protein n=1 Tax=Pseudomonas panipatensis TaxID=428992 RepID=UPI0011135410|nr:TraK family protein [Pseudomonas panipatensis]
MSINTTTTRNDVATPLKQQTPQTKSLSERVAERVLRKPNASVAARNRSVFLSLRLEIQQAYTEGWSLLAIWKTLFDENRVSFTYQAFRRYARQLIDSPTSANAIDDRTKEASAPHAQPKADDAAFVFKAKSSKKQLP